MFQYVVTFTAMIIAPLGALILHYTPLNTDKILKTPITDYSLNGEIFSYNVGFNDIRLDDLVAPLRSDAKQVNVYLKAGPDHTAYPYLITPRADKPKDDFGAGAYFITGDIISISERGYNIRYDNETVSLSKPITAKLSDANSKAIKAVWHVRSNGASRFAGLEIDGEFIPYQFSLNSALFGRTQ